MSILLVWFWPHLAMLRDHSLWPWRTVWEARDGTASTVCKAFLLFFLSAVPLMWLALAWLEKSRARKITYKRTRQVEDFGAWAELLNVLLRKGQKVEQGALPTGSAVFSCTPLLPTAGLLFLNLVSWPLQEGMSHFIGIYWGIIIP